MTNPRIRLLIPSAIFLVCAFFALKSDLKVFGILMGELALGILIVLVLYPFRLRQVLIKVFSSSSQRPAKPEEFPLLDNDKLERLTQEWQGLGFVPIGDFAGGEANPKIGTTFLRIFQHNSEGTLLEMMQQFTPQRTLPLYSSLMSLWGEGEREPLLRLAHSLEQSVAMNAPLAAPDSSSSLKRAVGDDELKIYLQLTHNRPPSRIYPLLRHPRVLSARTPIGASPEQLWQLHQSRCALVSARLGTPPLQSDLLALMRAHARVLGAIMVGQLRKISLWRIASLQFVPRSIPWHYDGDLAPLGREESA